MVPNGYVFLCSNSTERECFDRLLFGGKEKYKKEVPVVKRGDTLFLFNYQEGLLHGIFEATSEAGENIQPDAWKGGFPWQVSVRIVEKCKPLSRADLIDALLFVRKKYPPAALHSDQLFKVEALFRSKKRLPNFENLIPYTCVDGHRVKSRGEALIDDWLFQHGILHAYEKQLIDNDGLPETMYCDFYIPASNTYVEFWGLKKKVYIQRKQVKLHFYKENNLTLIEINPENLDKIDELLGPLVGA